jgi:hypothetical protein
VKKEEQRKRIPSPNQKPKNPKWVAKGKGTNYVPKPPHPPITKCISKREMKFERVGSLQKPSLAMGNAPQNRNKQVLRLKFSC